MSSLGSDGKKLFAYKLVVSYEGTHYFGWQAQPSGNTLEQEFLKALAKLLPRNPFSLQAASRTDSGVHAEGQTVKLRTTESIRDLVVFSRSLSSVLNPHIGLVSLEECPPRFHPIADARSKTYRYRIYRHPFASPFYRDFSWHLWGDLDLKRMKAEIGSLVGTHDFTSFCAADSSAKTKVRKILAAYCDDADPRFLDLWFVGEGFLKQMIRILVGTLVAQGQGKIPQSLPELLALRDRTKAGKTAPARGLCLMKVDY